MYNTENIPTNNEFGEVFAKNKHHFHALQEIMSHNMEEWRGCGSYMIGPDSLDYIPEMIAKQLSLYECAKTAKIALEIGVFGGHSLLIMLLANPDIHIVCNDICYYSHTEKSINYLQSVFPNQITFYKGASLDVFDKNKGLPTINLLHIDGNHDPLYIEKEFEVLYPHVAKNGYIVFDDYKTPQIEYFIYKKWKDLIQVVRTPPCEGIYGTHCVTCKRV